MSLLGALIDALIPLGGFVERPRTDAPTVNGPSWEVIFDGYEIKGNTLKALCTVRVWSGTDDDPLAELILEKHAATVMNAVKEVDCALFATGFDRLQPENPMDWTVQHVAGQVSFREA